MIIQCCMCKRVHQEEKWVKSAFDHTKGDGRVSHGYCPACLQTAYAEIEMLPQTRKIVATL